jgi:hypothetical protein
MIKMKLVTTLAGLSPKDFATAIRGARVLRSIGGKRGRRGKAAPTRARRNARSKRVKE